MYRKNFVILFAALVISIAVQGCTQTADTNEVRNTNANRAEQSSNMNATTGEANMLANSSMNNVVSAGNITQPGNKKPVSPNSDPKPNIGSGGSDLSILLEARGKLSSDKELVNNVIIVVKDGAATLTGNVLSEEQKKRAEDLVKSVQGLKAVKNNLRVSS